MCTGSEKKRSAWDTTRYLVPQPMWLMGLVCMGGTLVFTALADVQPILVIELIFTLALRAPVCSGSWRWSIRQEGHRNPTLTGWIVALARRDLLIVLLLVLSTALLEALSADGPLAVSQPALFIVDRLTSIAIGIELFGEQINNSPLGTAFEMLFPVAMCAGWCSCPHGCRPTWGPEANAHPAWSSPVMLRQAPYEQTGSGWECPCTVRPMNMCERPGGFEQPDLRIKYPLPHL